MKNKIFQIVVLATAVIFIGNLNAVVDSMLHPEISFFDKEHLIVGGISGVFTLVLLTFVYAYFNKLSQSNYERRLLTQNFHHFFNNANDIIIVSNKDLKIVDANEKALKTYGYTRDELLRLHIKNLRSPETLTQFNEQVTQVEKHDKLIFETMHIKKDGTVFPVEVSTRKIEIDGVKYYQSIVRDISERQNAETRLSLSRTLIDHSNDSIELIDFETLHFIDVNNKECIDLGYTYEQLISMTPFDIDLLINHLLAAQIKEKLIKDGSATFESLHKRKDGTTFPVELNMKYFKLDKEYIVNIVRDITTRKKAEESLRVSEDRYRDLVENSYDLMCTHDLEGKILSANPAAFRSLGYESESFHDMNIKDILAPEYKHLFDNYLSTVLTKGLATGIMIVQSKAGEKRMWEYSNSLRTEGIDKPIVRGIAHDITARKLAEQQLLAEKNQLETIINSSPASIWFKDKKNNFIRVNKAAAQIARRSIDEVEGHSADEIFPNESKKYFQDDLEVINSGKPKLGIIESATANGLTTWVQTDKVPCYDDHGNITGVIAFAMDITALKTASDALRQSELKYRNIFDNAPVGIYQSNLDGDFLSVNDKLVEILGYDSKEELLKKHLSTDVYLDDSEREKLIAKYKPIGSAADLEIKWKKKDETPIWIQLTSNAVKDSSGKTLFFDGFVRDITDRKKTELEIMKLSEAVSQSPASILITDLNGNIIYVNKTLEEVTGYVLEEVYMKNPRLLQSGLTPKEQYQDLWNTILSGKTWRGELLNKKKNGELFWEDALISPVKDKEGNVINYLAVKQDITEKKKTLEELVSAKEQAEKSEQLKTEFLAQMSHEIRTPLNIIMSNISFVKEEVGSQLNEESSELFESIDLSSKRIIRTVDLILNMSELQTGSFRPVFVTVDLNKDILQELIKEFSGFASFKQLALSYKMEAQRTHVTADRYCLMQIFANLIDNAIKYTKSGSVWITIKNEKPDNIVVTVKDTGIGMSQDFKLHMFEPFVQEEHGYSRKFEGSGLGLTLVKKYCEINNAIIEVESEKNIGSTFRVTFNI